MMTDGFPEYALKRADSARKLLTAMTQPIRQVIDEIEAELCVDPKRYPERLIAASRDGRGQIYKHPSPDIQVTFEIDEAAKVIYVWHYFAPTLSPPQTIFVSYSHLDKAWLDTIRRFLTILEQRGLIRFWDDRSLKHGEPWQPQIREILDSSRAALLLVSQNFLTSQFINGVELPRLLHDAREQGKRIYWLQLTPSTVFTSHQEIAEFQSLLENPRISLAELQAKHQVELDKALVTIAEKLLADAQSQAG
jgi:hypothetical protein